MTAAMWLLESEPPGGEPQSLDLTEATSAIEASLRRCEANVTEAGEAEVLARIRTSWVQLRRNLESGSMPRSGLRQDQLFSVMLSDIEELVSINERAMVTSESDTRRVARAMVGAVGFSGVAALAALGLFALISANRISRPVTDVANLLHHALNPRANGLMAARVAEPLDEIVRLRNEVDALLGRLGRYEDEQAQRLTHLEERLTLVTNEVMEGLVFLDEDHRVVAANRVGRAVLGIPARETRKLRDCDLRDDVTTLLRPLIERTFRDREADFGEIGSQVDGSERIFRARALTLPGPGGTVQGYLVLFWDVTEQHRFEEARRRFISMLSHQLKTPMTSLVMSVNLLREKLDAVSEEDRELLSIAAEDCSAVSTLISDLVDASRASTAAMSLRVRRTDVVRLLRSSLWPLVRQAVEKDVRFILPVEGPPVFAEVDPVKFSWVVTNIAGNALRYTPPGGSIEVSVCSAERNVEICVKDTGTGIARENLERIFEPYVSLEREPHPGTHGLGLAIAKEIVDAHGGAIHASSEVGKGTRFLIRLPARLDAAS